MSNKVLVINDLESLLIEVKYNSGNVKGDARLLHGHVNATSFGANTQTVRTRFNQVCSQLEASETPLHDATKAHCIQSLQELILVVYQTLSKSQKRGVYLTVETAEFLSEKLIPNYHLKKQRWLQSRRLAI